MIPDTIIPIIGILAGTATAGFIFAKITGLIRHWMDTRNRTSSDDLAAIVTEFKAYQHTVERRLQNLEAIAAGEKETEPLLDTGEDQEDINKENEPSESRLQNMLKKTR